MNTMPRALVLWVLALSTVTAVLAQQVSPAGQTAAQGGDQFLDGIGETHDTIRGVNACPNMQIVVGGGVFNRAPGLAEEIGADLWATNPMELIEKLSTHSTRRATAEQRTVGKTRKVRAEAA